MHGYNYGHLAHKSGDVRKMTYQRAVFTQAVWQLDCGPVEKLGSGLENNDNNNDMSAMALLPAERALGIVCLNKGLAWITPLCSSMTSYKWSQHHSHTKKHPHVKCIKNMILYWKQLSIMMHYHHYKYRLSYILSLKFFKKQYPISRTFKYNTFDLAMF